MDMSVLRCARALIAGVFSFAPSAALAQRLGGAATPEISVWRIVLALTVSLAIGIAAIYLLRGRHKNGKSQRIGDFLKRKMHEGDAILRVIARQRLSAETEIILLQCRDQEYLLIAGTAHSSLLANYPAVVQNPETESAR